MAPILTIERDRRPHNVGCAWPEGTQLVGSTRSVRSYASVVWARTILSLVVVVSLAACSTSDQTEAACQQQDQARRSLLLFDFDEYVGHTDTLRVLSHQSEDEELRSLGTTISETALEWQSADYPNGALMTLTVEANSSYAERCRALGYPATD